MYRRRTYDITDHYKRRDGSKIALQTIYINTFGRDYRDYQRPQDAMEDAAAALEIFQNMIETIQLPRHDPKGYYDEEKWQYMTL